MPKQRTEQRLQNGTCSWISCMQVDSGGEGKKKRCWGEKGGAKEQVGRRKLERKQYPKKTKKQKENGESTKRKVSVYGAGNVAERVRRERDREKETH